MGFCGSSSSNNTILAADFQAGKKNNEWLNRWNGNGFA